MGFIKEKEMTKEMKDLKAYLSERELTVADMVCLMDIFRQYLISSTTASTFKAMQELEGKE